MDEYFRTLGIKPGADEDEIKRAYFKMVKLHSPEKDPEGFEQIRRAYEMLISCGGFLSGPSLPGYVSDEVRRILKEAEIFMKDASYRALRDCYEKCLRIYPDEPYFLYYLVDAQIRVGNTAKAVRGAQHLVETDPHNKWYWRILAISCLERGYNKKALIAFARAYDLGVRDLDFMILFGRTCDICEQYETGVAILLPLVKSDRRWRKPDMPYLYEAYTALICMNIKCGVCDYCEIFDIAAAFIKRYNVLIDSNVRDLLDMLTEIELTEELNSTEKEKLQNLINDLRKVCPDYNEPTLSENDADDMFYKMFTESEQ